MNHTRKHKIDNSEPAGGGAAAEPEIKSDDLPSVGAGRACDESECWRLATSRDGEGYAWCKYHA